MVNAPEDEKILDQYSNYAKVSFGNYDEEKLKNHIEYWSEYSFLRYFKSKDYWGDVVIDFGGRIGERTRKVKNVTVVDISKDCLAYMKSHEIKCTSSLDDFKDESVDLIFASHVLEHLYNPYDYLVKFKKKLKKDGKLMLVLPLESQTERPPDFYDPNGHLYCWNSSTIHTLLRFAGFRVKESRVIPMTVVPAIFFKLFSPRSKKFIKIIYFLQLALGNLFKKTIMQIIRYTFIVGGEIYIIAEKQ